MGSHLNAPGIDSFAPAWNSARRIVVRELPGSAFGSFGEICPNGRGFDDSAVAVRACDLCERHVRRRWFTIRGVAVGRLIAPSWAGPGLVCAKCRC